MKNRFQIIAEEIPESFSTPIGAINVKYGNKNNIILRSANSIDLLMTQEETKNHLLHIISEKKGRQVWYFFNKHILYKAANENSFRITDTMKEAQFTHNTRPALITQK